MPPTISGKRYVGVIARTAVEFHPLAVLARDDPEAIMLDLIRKPSCLISSSHRSPEGGCRQGFGGKARSDEAAHVRIYAPSRVSHLPKIDRIKEPAGTKPAVRRLEYWEGGPLHSRKDTAPPTQRGGL